MRLGAQPIPVFGMILKRAMDVIGSAIGPAFLLFVLAIAVAIRLDTAGPVYYQVGASGRRDEIVCYKFRTMVENPPTR